MKNRIGCTRKRLVIVTVVLFLLLCMIFREKTDTNLCSCDEKAFDNICRKPVR